MLRVRHCVEEVEIEQVTVAVASRVTFPSKARLGSPPSFVSRLVMLPTAHGKLAKYAQQHPVERHYCQTTTTMDDLP